MAKKVLMIFLSVMLIASLTLISCSQDQKKPGPAPQPLEPVENKAGEVSGNKVYNGDFNKGSESDLVIEEGSTMNWAETAGVDGSGAMDIYQGNNYGQCYVDATELHGRGKSYYVSATFKDNPLTKTREEDSVAHISYTVVSGAVIDAVATHSSWEGYYDCDDIYGGEFLSEDDALEIFGMTTDDPTVGVEFDDTTWVTVSGIIPATEIDRILSETTDKYGDGSEQTIQYLLVCFYVGEYQDVKEGPGQTGYGYYIDNVVIKDLNKELKATGRTYKKESPEEPEEDEDESDLTE